MKPPINPFRHREHRKHRENKKSRFTVLMNRRARREKQDGNQTAKCPVVQSQDRRLHDTPQVAVTSRATGGWPVPPPESSELLPPCSRLPNSTPASRPQAAIPAALALGRRVDRFGGICHSQPHPHRPAAILPSAPCLAQSASATRPAASRRASGLIQIPNTVDLNPAVQSNGSYPPCCRTADKSLFVRFPKCSRLAHHRHPS